MGVPFIVVTLNSKVIERKRLDKKEMTIGRIEENDIVINNLAVSRRHAKIYIKDGKVFIKDLVSANGTFVNGLMVDEAELKKGDSILIGKHIIKFCDEETQRPEENVAFQGERHTVMVDPKTQEKFLEKLKSEKLNSDSLSNTPKLTLSDGKEVEIKKDFFTIGNGYDSSLKIGGLFVKSRHAKIIKRSDGTYRIVSMGSFLRPTKVNGSRIKETTLQDGDTIKIGKHEMTFTL
jgi:pSer/pThr/pTyr-binding forkhead associated (FHA) protein